MLEDRWYVETREATEKCQTRQSKISKLAKGHQNLNKARKSEIYARNLRMDREFDKRVT